MATISKIPSIPVRIPKNRFQSEQDELNKIGQRVSIPSLDNMTGILRYVGEPDFKNGIWAGIELDNKGEGKNDGSVQGKRYFVCPPNTGIFIGISKIVMLPATATASTKKKPSPTTSATRKSNLPLTRSSTNNSNNTINSTTTKKRTTPNLRNSSVPTTSQSIEVVKTPKRSTITPTLNTSTTPPPPAAMTRKKSTPTPPPVSMATIVTPTPPPPPATPSVPSQSPATTQAPSPAHIEETNQLFEILNKVTKERDTLLSQMKSKETAWERLVSSKESLSLQVEEKELKSRRLERELVEKQQELASLQQDLATKEASLQKNVRDEQKTSQDQKRIEKLELLLRELQLEIKTLKEEDIHKKREHQGAIDQIRREVSQSEAINESLEKENEELRRASLEAIHAYELSVIQLKEQHQLELKQKNHTIQQLDYIIADLRHKQSTLFDDELSIDTRLKEMQQPNRLEEQLELTMTELDAERKQIINLQYEIDQLKLELKSSRQQIVNMEQKYNSLQVDFEKELSDKKRLIEEADDAFENQAKAEDEHYQTKLSKQALEKQLQNLQDTHKQLESDYNQLMDDMLLLEKQNANGVTTTTDGDLTEKLTALEKENETHRQSLSLKSIQVTQLSKELADLESLVENRVFGESDLEEQLELEKKKAAQLERELKAVKQQRYLSPSTSSTTPIHEDLLLYCDLCERYGHDVLQCKSANQQPLRMYCDNCDDYGTHDTASCPNQDETF